MRMLPGGFPSKITGLLAGMALLLFVASGVRASDRFPTHPTTNHGKKWRIGYYEGGPYVNYPANLLALAAGLAELGWMKTVARNAGGENSDSKAIWDALVRSGGRYLQFVPQAYWSAQWDEIQRTRNRAEAIQWLQNRQLDFMIAMGTWAGQDLASNGHCVATMVVSSSDPVRSGIVKSAANSGFDHVHARCEPNRYGQQVRLFHDIFDFKRLGVVYENTLAGRSYAAMADIEKVAAQGGFELVTCEAPWSGLPPQACTRNLIECHKTLAPRIDALFFTVHRGANGGNMDEILLPLVEHRIPTWSQRGPQDVRQGVLLSISRGGFDAIGRYHAGIMAKILNGARPGALSQIFEDPKGIAINLKAAEAIGFEPPRGLMRVADEIYK